PARARDPRPLAVCALARHRCEGLADLAVVHARLDALRERRAVAVVAEAVAAQHVEGVMPREAMQAPGCGDAAQARAGSDRVDLAHDRALETHGDSCVRHRGWCGDWHGVGPSGRKRKARTLA